MTPSVWRVVSLLWGICIGMLWVDYRLTRHYSDPPDIWSHLYEEPPPKPIPTEFPAEWQRFWDKLDRGQL